MRLLIGRFWAPPLFSLQSPPARFFNAVATPILWGLWCGLLAGISPLGYGAALLLSLAGAFGAGRQHHGLIAGVLRGLAAGVTFGVSVLVGHALGGAGASTLPHPEALQVLFAGTAASVLAGVGGVTRAQWHDREDLQAIGPTA
jgi:hypothetical protein